MHFPNTLTRLPFNVSLIGLICSFFFGGLLLIDSSTNLSLKPFLILVFLVHLWLFLSRLRDISETRILGRIYAWIVCGTGIFLVALSIINPSTGYVQNFNRALLGFYMIFLVIAFPLIISCAIRGSNSLDGGAERNTTYPKQPVN